MKKALNLIIIENDDNDFELLLLKLTDSGYEFRDLVRVDSEEGFRNALKKSHWDIILSDYSLPGFTASLALSILRQTGLDVPFVIVSGTIGEERAVSSLRAGARDFVSKNDLNRLIPIIERELREFNSRKLRQKVEVAYRESEQKYRLIVNTAREGILMLDESGVITFANKEMARLFELHEQEILRKNLQDFIHPKVGQDKRTYFEFLSTEQSGQHVLLFMNQTGTWWGEARFSIIPQELAREKSYLCMITDVTEKVESHRTIEGLVDELKVALKVRDEFLSIASHELKTPLTSLLIQAQQQKRLINRDDEKAFERGRVQMIAEQTEKLALRLNRLVEDMLDISRIKSGKLSIIKEEANLKSIVSEVIKRLSGQFAHSGSGAPEMLAEDVRGHWDVGRIEQVITNLLTNAIRYGKGKPIAVTLKQLDGKALLIVEDQGIGISKSARERIFDRFERAINLNDISGLGLGLFISKEIIKAHDGKIWVESELDKGSKFFVELPL